MSTGKAFWLFAAPWFMLVATVSTCKASMFSQLHDWCLWRQRAVATNINHGTANHECFTSAGCRHKHKSWSCEKNNMIYKCSLSPWSSIMELRKTGCVTWARCRSNHQSWSCSSLISLLPFRLLLQIQGWCLLRHSARVKHSVFRSSMIDTCGDIEHFSSILLLQWAMVKHPAFFYYYSHSYSYSYTCYL